MNVQDCYLDESAQSLPRILRVLDLKLTLYACPGFFLGCICRNFLAEHEADLTKGIWCKDIVIAGHESMPQLLKCLKCHAAGTIIHGRSRREQRVATRKARVADLGEAKCDHCIRKHSRPQGKTHFMELMLRQNLPQKSLAVSRGAFVTLSSSAGGRYCIGIQIVACNLQASAHGPEHVACKRLPPNVAGAYNAL